METMEKFRIAADEFARKAMENYGVNIDKIILFGSVARGEADKKSDIDILVVWNGKEEDGWRKMTGLAFEILLETQEYISIKVVTPQDLESQDPFINNVVKDGIEIAYGIS